MTLRGALILTVLLLAAPSFAQEESDKYRVTSEVTPDRGESADDYSARVRGQRVRTDATYATGIEGDLAQGAAPPEKIERDTSRRSAPVIDGGFGVFLMVALILVLILVLLRYGGAGGLLAREPEQDNPVKAPENWNINEGDENLTAAQLLARIAGMTDRRDALVHLLRHSLLAAGSASDTRFARSDTEREAFARIPETWRQRDALKLLLKLAEISHYGGRAVTDEGFASALEAGRKVFNLREVPHAG